ncbi:MAG: hypothetical protein ACXWCB_14850 [Acidimicrobiales bacterium]
MTTVPLDDVVVDPDPRLADPAAPDASSLPVWRLVARWKAAGHRVLPGVTYPIAVWIVWRLSSLAISVYLGGTPGHSAFFYDSAHYLRIMHRGYNFPRWIMPSHAFFPAVSWLGWPIWKLSGSDLLTVHLVASATGIAAFIAVWGVSKAWRDEIVARRAVLLFALFPSSLFLWAFYSEGIFIALGAGAVWADRRGKRGLAAALLVGIGATRSIGILIPAVIILVRIIHQRRVDKWCVVYGAAGATGLLAVLAVMHAQVGDAFAWMKVQKDWGRSPSAPWTTIEQGFHNLWPAKGTVMVPALVARNLDLWCILIVVLGLGYAALSRRDRFPMETWVLGVAMIILPLCSSVLASFNRFVFADWVLFPVYASAIGRLPKPWRIASMSAIAAACILTSYAMIGRFSIGSFVG